MYIHAAGKFREFGVMQSIDQKMGVSVRQIYIAKHYLMTDDVEIYHFKSIVRLTLVAITS